MGYVVMTKALGGTVHAIVLWPYGGFARVGPHDKGPSGGLKIAIAGPLTHFPQAVVWFGLYYLAAKGDMRYFTMLPIYAGVNFFAVLFCQGILFNIYLFCFHILPAYPLAGGKILAAIMLMSKVDKAKVATVVGKTGIVIASLLAINAFLVFVFSWKNRHFPIFTFILIVIIAWYGNALINVGRDGNFDNHPLFRSSVVTTNNADSLATPYATATTTTSTGQAATSGGEEYNKTAWWKFGGKKAEETKNKEVDVDYGFS